MQAGRNGLWRLPPLGRAISANPMPRGPACRPLKLAAARAVLAEGRRLIWTDDEVLPEPGPLRDELTRDGRALLIAPQTEPRPATCGPRPHRGVRRRPMTACATFSTVIRFWQGGEMSDRFGAFGAPVPETGPAAQHIAQRVASRRRGILRRTVMTHDITSLDDHETVARWIRHMHEGTSQTVTVNRPWGSVFAISMGRPPAGVMVESGTRLLYAGSPAGMVVPDVAPLTPAQVEQLMIEALTADHLPGWPQWREG